MLGWREGGEEEIREEGRKGGGGGGGRSGRKGTGGWDRRREMRLPHSALAAGLIKVKVSSRGLPPCFLVTLFFAHLTLCELFYRTDSVYRSPIF